MPLKMSSLYYLCNIKQEKKSVTQAVLQVGSWAPAAAGIHQAACHKFQACSCNIAGLGPSNFVCKTIAKS